MTRPLRQNPTTLRLRYQAWHLSQQSEGNLSVDDLAAALDVSTRKLRAAIRNEKWAGTLRATQTDFNPRPEPFGTTADADIEAREFAGAVA